MVNRTLLLILNVTRSYDLFIVYFEFNFKYSYRASLIHDGMARHLKLSLLDRFAPQKSNESFDEKMSSLTLIFSPERSDILFRKNHRGRQ